MFDGNFQVFKFSEQWTVLSTRKVVLLMETVFGYQYYFLRTVSLISEIEIKTDIILYAEATLLLIHLLRSLQTNNYLLRCLFVFP